MDSATIKSGHSTFCGTWIVVFNEAVIEPLALHTNQQMKIRNAQEMKFAGENMIRKEGAKCRPTLVFS